MDEKNWLEPTEILQYDPELGRQNLEELGREWDNKLTNGIGDPIEGTEEELDG